MVVMRIPLHHFDRHQHYLLNKKKLNMKTIIVSFILYFFQFEYLAENVFCHMVKEFGVVNFPLMFINIHCEKSTLVLYLYFDY